MPLQPRGAAGARPSPQCRASRPSRCRARELIDATLKRSGHGDIETLEADLWRDLQPDFRTSHYLDGFAHRDGKFHFKADWAHPPIGSAGLMGAWEKMPALPDHWAIIEEADEAHPFRLATSPSRSFLNTTFNETPSSQAREGAPTVMIHPADAASLAISPMAMPSRSAIPGARPR